ncbi:MAG: hypothetical protein IKK58_06105 [Clostridia bacterium]|nr:hypothetical protein [Clostridia bacterium]
MKKTLIFICVAIMLCTVALTASAATVGTAYTIEYSGISIDIDIIDDFASYSGTSTYGDFTYNFSDGKLSLQMPSGGWGWEGPSYESPSLALEGLEAAYNNATYIGLSVKNTGDATGVLCFEDRVADPTSFATQVWGMEGVKLVSSEGIVDATGYSVPSRRYGIEIPGGFEGWVFIPFAAMKIQHADAGLNQDNYAAKFECPHFTGTAKDDGQVAVLEIDNVFLSSDELVMNESERPTADVSVIAYAAMAITGLGALLVAKKR